MPKTIIAEGKTSTEAIEKGLKELKATRSQVDVKILEEKKKSFFSILDPHVVKVELTIREDSIPEKKEKKQNREQIFWRSTSWQRSTFIISSEEKAERRLTDI